MNKETRKLLQFASFGGLLLSVEVLILVTPPLQNRFDITLIAMLLLCSGVYAIARKHPARNKMIAVLLGAMIFGILIGIAYPYVTASSVELIALILLGITIAKTALTLSLSYKNSRRKKTKRGSYNPLVSILSPCFNEEKCLENCVKGLLQQTYQNLEIVIIDDGSTDSTREIGERLAATYDKVSFIHKHNGGKASALNLGIKKAKGEIILSMDGDTVLKADAVEHMVRKFKDPTVMAVAGNPRVANATNLITKIQSIEYPMGFTLQQRTFDELGCIPVISGGIGAFRKEKLLELGGYSSDTITEDFDLTMAFAKNRWRVVFCSDAIAYTEAPATIEGLMKQRYRWFYGKNQVLKKYKCMMLNKEYGMMGLFGMPYFMLSPWIDTLISVVAIALAAEALLVGAWATYVLIFMLFMVVSIAILFYVVYIDGVEEIKGKTPYSIVQSLFYIHLMNLINLRAWINYQIGKPITWGKIARTGTNVVR